MGVCSYPAQKPSTSVSPFALAGLGVNRVMFSSPTFAGGFLYLVIALAATPCACLTTTRRAASWSVTCRYLSYSPRTESVAGLRLVMFEPAVYKPIAAVAIGYMTSIYSLALLELVWL